MLSLFDTAKRILKSFFDDNLFSINDILSKTKIEALIRAIDKGIKKDYDKVLKSVNKEVRSKLKNEYNQFIKKGVFRVAPTLQKYKIEDLKPDFKKELESRINVSLSYITTQDQNTIEEIKNRLMNFASIPHPNKNLKELEYDFWNDIIPAPKVGSRLISKKKNMKEIKTESLQKKEAERIINRKIKKKLIMKIQAKKNKKKKKR